MWAFGDGVSYRVEVDSLKLIDSWPVTTAGAAVIGAGGNVLGQRGEVHNPFALASVSKLISAYGALIAIEEEAVTLDTPVAVTGARVRHLLSHTSGVAFESLTKVAEPGERRIYSNAGFELLAETITAATEIPFAQYIHEALTQPLGMRTIDTNGAAAGMSASVTDVIQFAIELQNPTLLHPSTLSAATEPVFPTVDGVLPGFGVQRPNPWGLGFEIRGAKSPHWTGSNNSPDTFGHFGQSGTFLWVDPHAQIAVIALTDRNFGKWAAEVWPRFSDAVLAEVAAQ